MAGAVARCGKCKRLLSRDAFDAHNTNGRGVQPFCRECDHGAKRKPCRGYNQYKKAAEKRGNTPWTKEEYLYLFERHEWKCWWCKALVYRWGGGYWLDRIDSSRGYEMDNCVPCCGPCNRFKGPANPAFWADVIGYIVKKYGEGRVPWGSLLGNVRAYGPDVSKHEVPDPQLDLLPIGGRR